MTNHFDAIDTKLQDVSELEIVFERAALDAWRRAALTRNEVVLWQDEQIVTEVPKLEDYPLEDDAP